MLLVTSKLSILVVDTPKYSSLTESLILVYYPDALIYTDHVGHNAKNASVAREMQHFLPTRGHVLRCK